ncbi:hypothetical protein [Thalassotalea maritima]
MKIQRPHKRLTSGLFLTCGRNAYWSCVGENRENVALSQKESWLVPVTFA